MIPATCKRLIEVDFPIAVVSAHSAKEKSIRHGHPSTLHLWWARRPLAACRAVLLGLLLPDPCDSECPPDFKTNARELLSKRFSKSAKTDESLQQLLLEFIGEFADWDHAANALYLEIGRGLVKAAHPEETPVVVDPFSGGGSIPLEALRLGCEAFASDLNPVACLILKTLLEDIPRYGNAEFKLPGKDGKEVVVHGLADALRHVGKQVKEAAEKELAEFYPPDLLCPSEMKGKSCVLIRVEDRQCATGGYNDMEVGLAKFQRAEPAEYWYLPTTRVEVARGAGPQIFGMLAGSFREPEQILSELGAKPVPVAHPIAYLWARTVRCEGIGCGAEIPLMGAFWLCKKAKRKVALRFRVERLEGKLPQVVFEVFSPKEDGEVPTSTVNRANATCLCCRTVLPAERVRAQLTNQRGGGDVVFDAKGHRIGGAILLAVVTVKDSSAERQYRVASDADYAAVFAAQQAVARQPSGAFPDEPSPTGGGKGAGRAFSVRKYGMAFFADLFTARQRLTALFLWTLQSTKPVGNGDKKPEISYSDEDEPGDDEDEQKAKKAKAGFTMPFDTFIRITRPMGIHYPALEGRVIAIEKGIVRLLPVRERSEQLLGEAATRPGAVISLEDVQQMELGLATRRQDEAVLPSTPKRGQKVKAAPGQAQEEATFTALDRIHRAMLLFGLGRSTLLRQVLEKELRQSQRFERLALSLNALYPDGSDERRMLEGVQAAMRGVK